MEETLLLKNDDEPLNSFASPEASGGHEEKQNLYKPKMSKRMMKAYNIKSLSDTDKQASPVLILESMNDTFSSKRIDLIETIKVGRQVSPKTPPTPENGVFDSKVLSRQHAEISYENGKVWIKDVASSNGTFVNGERLSAEGVPSEKKELKNGDVLEFGVDIMNDSNTQVLYKKVSCKVSVLSSDAEISLDSISLSQSSNYSAAPVKDLNTSKEQPSILADLKQKENVPAIDNLSNEDADEQLKKALEANSHLQKLSKDLSDVDKLIDLKSEPSSSKRPEDSKELEELKGKVSGLQKELENRKNQQQELQNSFNTKESGLKKSFETEKALLMEKITLIEASLEQERQKSIELKADSDQLLTQLSQKDDLITKARQEYDAHSLEMSKQITEKDSLLSQKQQEIDALNAKLKSELDTFTANRNQFEDQIVQLKKNLEKSAQNENIIEDLKKQIEVLTIRPEVKAQNTSTEDLLKSSDIGTNTTKQDSKIQLGQIALVALVSFIFSYGLLSYQKK